MLEALMTMSKKKKIHGNIIFLFQSWKCQLSFVCCFAEAKFSAWNLFKLTSYGKFGFFRPDLDGNKLAKGMCLARQAIDREVFL